MFKELELLYDATDHSNFEQIVENWKNRFLKFYPIICQDCQHEWEKVYRTCLFLEAMYGSELAKSLLFYDDTRFEIKIREENAIGALLSETAGYYVVLKRLTKDELINELDKCLEKIKKEEENE